MGGRVVVVVVGIAEAPLGFDTFSALASPFGALVGAA